MNTLFLSWGKRNLTILGKIMIIIEKNQSWRWCAGLAFHIFMNGNVEIQVHIVHCLLLELHIITPFTVNLIK
jgi:hypothetical protein